MIRDKEQDAYFKEAKGWDDDRIENIKTSEKRAWYVALGSSVIAICAVAAVLGLTPLKESIPYVIRVDNSTGITDIVRVLKDEETNYDESINRYFVQQYVKYREGYSRDLAEEYYTNVGLMSGGNEKSAYYNMFNPSNPMSPLVLYSNKARVNIKIKSTTFINKKTALVRYLKSIERGGSQKPEVSHWTATIVFKYEGRRVDDKSREVNPLGFLVKEYRNDVEVVPVDPMVKAQPTKKEYGASAGFEKQEQEVKP